MRIAKLEPAQAMLLTGVVNLGLNDEVEERGNLRNLLCWLEEEFEMGVYVHQYLLAELVSLTNRGLIEVHDGSTFEKLWYEVTEKGMRALLRYQYKEKVAHGKRMAARAQDHPA